MTDVENLISLLCSKDTKSGCNAMNELIKLSRESESIYCHMGDFLNMTDSPNSYIRTRGLLLICENSVWDKDMIIDKNIEKILSHIIDEKPITSRQFISALPLLVENKPQLRETIRDSLSKADASHYSESMRGLVENDICEALKKIN